MIKINDKKYGKVVILDSEDIEYKKYGEFVQWGTRKFKNISWKDRIQYDIIAFRDIKEKYVEIFKNRYFFDLDIKIKEYVLSYRIKEEVLELINSRFDILDL